MTGATVSHPQPRLTLGRWALGATAVRTAQLATAMKLVIELYVDGDAQPYVLVRDAAMRAGAARTPLLAKEFGACVTAMYNALARAALVNTTHGKATVVVMSQSALDIAPHASAVALPPTAGAADAGGSPLPCAPSATLDNDLCC